MTVDHDAPVCVPFEFFVQTPEGRTSRLGVEVRLLSVEALGREGLESESDSRLYPTWGMQATDDGRVVMCRLRAGEGDLMASPLTEHYPNRATSIGRFRGKLLNELEKMADRVYVELSGEGGMVARFLVDGAEGGPDEWVDVVLRPSFDL